MSPILLVSLRSALIVRVSDLPRFAGFENSTREGTNLYKQMNDGWDRIAPISFMYERGTKRSKHDSDQLRQFYFKGRPIDSNNNNGLAEVPFPSAQPLFISRVSNALCEESPRSVHRYTRTA